MQVMRHLLRSPAHDPQRELVSLHYGRPGGAKAYVQASLHGNELPAMLVAHHLRQQLDALHAADQIAGEIVLVPMANPIGLGRSSQVVDEVELRSLRRALMRLSCDADIVLDMHCDAQALLHLYTDAHCWIDCEPLARFLGARLTLLARGAEDDPFEETGSQSWWKWDRHFDGCLPTSESCLSVTVKLRGAADATHALAAHDANNIIDFLRWRGLVCDDKLPVPGAVGDARPLAGSMPICSPVAGALAFVKEVGSDIRAGEVLAQVIDPMTGGVTELKSPVDGLIFASDFRRFAHAGAQVAKVAGHVALRGGKFKSTR